MALITLVILTSTLPCFSQWEGRPWADNTNGVNWYALQKEYQPYRQLFNALVERADAVRATVNTNYPMLQLVQTWQIDAGSVTNVLGSNTVVYATGFPLSYFGDNLNGGYESASGSTPWIKQDDAGLSISESGGLWYIGSYDYASSNGPASASWFDEWDANAPVSGSTSFGAAGNFVALIATNVTTTNAFGPFPYSVTVGETTYSGTGLPHLTYAAMEWIDNTITDLSAYYMPVMYSTGVYHRASEWASGGPFSLIGMADVGHTETGTQYIVYPDGYVFTNHTAVSAYTRQPEITNNWPLAEWVWNGSNWVRTVTATFDMRRPLGSAGPLVEAYSVTGTPISVTVILKGELRKDHWMQTGLTNGVETVQSGSTSTNLWESINFDTTIANGFNTGDVVTVAYRGPVVLYGTRPYRLYASDFDERAAVIDLLRYMSVPVNTRYNQDAYPSAGVIPAWTNGVIAHIKTNAVVTAGTNNADHPAWSELLPFDPPGNEDISKPALTQIWTSYSLTRSSFPFNDGHPYYPTLLGYTNAITIEATQISAQLPHTMIFTTNMMQGTNMFTAVSLKSFVTCFVGGFGDAATSNVPVIDGQPVYVDSQTEEVPGYYEWQVSRENSLSEGTNILLSGRVGHTNWLGGSIPAGLPPSQYILSPYDLRYYYDVNSIKDYYYGYYESQKMSWGYSWGNWEGFSGWPSVGVFGIISVVDWAGEGGFLYK